ncbi:hypothetical protein BLOT_000977 [Blomia tropicalis]|nr:hypothetical protein BLOT_000977 [Blomia tropicalis]
MSESVQSGKDEIESSEMNDTETNVVETKDEFEPQSDHEVQVVKIIPLPHARSEVWNYFGFVADSDGHILDRAKVVCKLCASTFCYSGNTTNFYSHLKSMHSELQMRAVLSKNGKTMKRSYASMNNYDDLNETEYENETSSPTIVKLYDTSLNDESNSNRNQSDVICIEDITHAIVDFLVTDCRPLSVTQGKGFQRLIHLLAPEYVMPEKQRLTNAIRRRFEDFRKEREQSID